MGVKKGDVAECGHMVVNIAPPSVGIRERLSKFASVGAQRCVVHVGWGGNYVSNHAEKRQFLHYPGHFVQK